MRDGLLLLHELGALEGKEKDGLPVLTRIGHNLARIPVDPRMARMLVEANTSGCLHDVMVIVAAMTIQDVRERPTDSKRRLTKPMLVLKTSLQTLWQCSTCGTLSKKRARR